MIRAAVVNAQGQVVSRLQASAETLDKAAELAGGHWYRLEEGEALEVPPPPELEGPQPGHPLYQAPSEP